MPPEVVGVLRQHVQEIYEALDTSATYFAALDLTENIKSGSPAPKASRTAQRMARARDRLAGYLEVDEDDKLPE